jgi:hypothetical protein
MKIWWLLTPEKPSVTTTFRAASATPATITCSPIKIYLEYLSIVDIIPSIGSFLCEYCYVTGTDESGWLC